MTPPPPHASPPPARRIAGWLLFGAIILLAGLLMLLAGLYRILQPTANRPKPTTQSAAATVTETPSPEAPAVRPARPGDNPDTARNPNPAGPAWPPTPPRELRTWPGRLAIFSDTPFSDGRPMELVQPIQWQPILSLADRGLEMPNRFARPSAIDPAQKRGRALPPDLRLYLTFNGAGDVLFAEVRNGRLALMHSAGSDQPLRVIADAALLPVTPDAQGVARTIFRFLFRDGQIAIAQDGRPLCDGASPCPFTGAMAWQTGPDPSLVFGDFELLNAGEILFRDDFMRAASDGFWKPLAGAWELEALTFPERSSNPFALKAVFSDRAALADLDKNRELFPGENSGGDGAGIQLDVHNNRIVVARITGDGPAARAGLMEEDIILALNGRTLTFRDMMHFYREIRHPTTGVVDLEILRPGEAHSRHILFKPGEFHWADVRLHERLPGSKLADRALIVAGQDHWQQYHALCALRFLSAGGAGMVLGAGQAGAIEIRWYGANRPAADLPANCLQVWKVRPEASEKLFERSLIPWRDTFYRLHANTTGPDLKITIDGVLVAALKNTQPPPGPVGLWAAQGNLPDVSPADDGVFFDDVEVVTDPEQITDKAQMRINRIMKNEQDMKLWANPSHEWIATCQTIAADAAIPGIPVVQYRADLPGHQSLVVKTPQPTAGQNFSLYLGLPLPPAQPGTITLPPPPATTPRSTAFLEGDRLPPDLATLGSAAYFPPGLSASNTHVDSVEAQKAVLRSGPAPVATPEINPDFLLPPLPPYALEWTFHRVGDVAWRWSLIDPQKTEPLKTGDCSRLPDALALVCLPGKIVARIDGRDVAILERDLAAAVGQSVAVSGLDNWPDDGVLTASSDQVLEYTFNNAPDDWAVHAGRWGLLNKWVCDPRWSWFGGRSDTGLAAIWHKTNFKGDIAVDYYAALMMYQNDPPYERPGDFNCTLFGDGRNMGSGYSLIFGGGDNRWSALTKNGRTAAWILDEAARLPSDRLRQQEKMTLHQKWFHIQLRRSGQTVSYSLDGQRWLSFDDPDPIVGGRVALWTRNNGYLLARVRIAYQQSLGPVLDEGRTAPFIAEDPVAAAVRVKTGAPAPTHRFDVNPTPLGNEWSQTGRWQTLLWNQDETPATEMRLLPPDGLAIRHATFPPAGPTAIQRPQEALTLTSPGGGSFAVGIQPARPFAFDPGHSRIRFWFRADPNTSIDLYFRTQRGNFFRLRLTGPELGPPGALELGDAGPNLADGQWRLLDLNLQARYEALLRDRYIQLNLAPLELLFAALSPCDGQLWSATCNPADATYSIAEFEVLPTLESSTFPTVTVTGDLRPIGRYLYALPLTSRPNAAMATVQATRRDGQTCNLDIGPTAAIRRNTDGADWSLDLTQLRPWLTDPADLSKLTILWQQGRLPGRQESVELPCNLPADPAFRWAGLRLTPALWLNPGAEKLNPVDRGAQPEDALPPANPTWIGAQPIHIDFGAVASHQLLADPPQPRNAMVTRLGPQLLTNPFTGQAALRVEPRVEGQNWGLSVPLQRDQAGMQIQTAQSRSGKMFRMQPGMPPTPLNGDPGLIPGGNADSQAYSLARYPLLRIDHRTPFEAPVNLRAWTGNASVSFTLTDRWAPFTWYLDDPAEFLSADRFTDDGRWRSELIDLRAIWQRDKFAANDDNPLPWLQNLQLVDNGWPGARKGIFLDYGRVQTVPACRADEFGVRLTDLPPTAFGADGQLAPGLTLFLAAAAPGQNIGEVFSLVPTDRNNAEQPAAQVFCLAAGDRAKIPSGVYWIYAVDAPAWQTMRAAPIAESNVAPSDATTPVAKTPPPRYIDACPVLIDNLPPAAVAIAPAANTSTSDTLFRFRLTDDNFLQPDSVRISLADRTLKLDDPAVQFDPTTGQVAVDFLLLCGRAGLPTQPTPLTLTLLAAADAIGNRLTEPTAILACTWVPAAPPQPAPQLAQWRIGIHLDDSRTALQEYRGLLHDSGFNRYEFLAGDGDFRGAGTAVTLTDRDPAWGARSLSARVADPLGEFFTTLYEAPWFVDDRPVLVFDYRATPGAPLQLECEVDGRRVVIPLEGPAGRLLDDGQWRHVAIDLSAYLRARCPDLKFFLVRRLRIAQASPRRMLAAAGVDIDNLALLDGPRAALLQLNWRTIDGAPPARVLYDINTLAERPARTPLSAAQLAGRDAIDVPFPTRDPLYVHLQATARNGVDSPPIHLKLWDLDLPLRRARQLHWLPE